MGIYDSEASGVRSGSIRARDANRATMPRAFTLRTALVVALACIASCPTPARALFDDLGEVVKLDAKNFDARVTNAKEDVYWLVKYYAPWCGHCKKLAPEWTKAAKALKKEVGDKAKLGAVDCDDATNKALCAKFNVNGFPTLKGFASRGKESHDFDGARDARVDRQKRAVFCTCVPVISTIAIYKDPIRCDPVEPIAVAVYALKVRGVLRAGIGTRELAAISG